MPIDPRDLGPEEVREALEWLEILDDLGKGIPARRNALALATMAARMLEEGPVRGAYLRPERWGGKTGWDPVLTSHPRVTDRPLYAFPEPLAYPEPGETDG
jgi:hypothetical protein